MNTEQYITQIVKLPLFNIFSDIDPKIETGGLFIYNKKSKNLFMYPMKYVSVNKKSVYTINKNSIPSIFLKDFYEIVGSIHTDLKGYQNYISQKDFYKFAPVHEFGVVYKFKDNTLHVYDKSEVLMKSVEYFAEDIKDSRSPINVNWRNNALCAQVDTDLFYPEKGGSTSPAMKVCARCDVKKECLLFALETKEKHGIWGGTTERQRRRMTSTDIENLKILIRLDKDNE